MFFNVVVNVTFPASCRLNVPVINESWIKQSFKNNPFWLGLLQIKVIVNCLCSFLCSTIKSDAWHKIQSELLYFLHTSTKSDDKDVFKDKKYTVYMKQMSAFHWVNRQWLLSHYEEDVSSENKNTQTEINCDTRQTKGLDVGNLFHN